MHSIVHIYILSHQHLNIKVNIMYELYNNCGWCNSWGLDVAYHIVAVIMVLMIAVVTIVVDNMMKVVVVVVVVSLKLVRLVILPFG